jgi:hypothetical protein
MEYCPLLKKKIGITFLLAIYCHVIDYIGGLDWWQDFIEHLHNLTTNNYDSPDELHTPKINVTTTHIKSSQSSLAVAR